MKTRLQTLVRVVVAGAAIGGILAGAAWLLSSRTSFAEALCWRPLTSYGYARRTLDESMVEASRFARGGPGAQIGTCAGYRYVKNKGLGGFTRFYDADGRMVGARECSDTPSYCGRSSHCIRYGRLPDCEMRETASLAPAREAVAVQSERPEPGSAATTSLSHAFFVRPPASEWKRWMLYLGDRPDLCETLTPPDCRNPRLPADARTLLFQLLAPDEQPAIFRFESPSRGAAPARTIGAGTLELRERGVVRFQKSFVQGIVELESIEPERLRGRYGFIFDDRRVEGRLDARLCPGMQRYTDVCGRKPPAP